MNTHTFPAHSGLTADWSCRAWRLSNAGERELWLIEDEEAGGFAVVKRSWLDGESVVEPVRDGLTQDAAFALLS